MSSETVSDSSDDSGGMNAGRDVSFADVERALVNSKSPIGSRFPFLGAIFRWVSLFSLHFGYMGAWGVVMAGMCSVVVGVGTTIESVVNYLSLLWAGGMAVLVNMDVVFTALAVVYVFYLLSFRELLHPNRPAYENPGRPKWQWLSLWTALAALAAVLCADMWAGTGYLSAVTGPVPGVALWGVYWGLSYKSSSALTATLYEDAELRSFPWVETPWKWAARVSLAYGVFVAAGVTIRWVPELWMSIAIALSVPVFCGLYLVRRALGSLVESGRNRMSAAERRDVFNAPADEKASTGEQGADVEEVDSSDEAGTVSEAPDESEWDYI